MMCSVLIYFLSYENLILSTNILWLNFLPDLQGYIIGTLQKHVQTLVTLTKISRSQQ